MYATIFKEEFNISLHVPKKDLCDFCEGFCNTKEEENITLQERCNRHIEEKKLCRLEKESDKMCSDKVVTVFDIQATLPCPQATRFIRASPIYVPDNYVTIVKQAKKNGNIFDVHEMYYTDFFDTKLLAKDLGVKDVFSNEDGERVHISGVSVVKTTKEDNYGQHDYKTSYTQENFQTANVL
ncbi:hypothetical protein PR048_004246 [Dryococelus australis]|uniref:Uncharacterized protein n=1 Tax=Dryococelus australis TaxID=614101 RepID=A0ABQ9I4Y4_9NEOP|nr:hypothetical protein PR048_004246 [Dryococelus australis]